MTGSSPSAKRWRRHREPLSNLQEEIPPTEEEGLESNTLSPHSFCVPPSSFFPNRTKGGDGQQRATSTYAPLDFSTFLATRMETSTEYAAACLWFSGKEWTRMQGKREMEEIGGTPGKPFPKGSRRSLLASDEDSGRGAWGEMLYEEEKGNDSAWDPPAEVTRREEALEVVELASIPEVRTGFLARLFEEEQSETAWIENGAAGEAQLEKKGPVQEMVRIKTSPLSKVEAAPPSDPENTSRSSSATVLFDTLVWEEGEADECKKGYASSGCAIRTASASPFFEDDEKVLLMASLRGATHDSMRKLEAEQEERTFVVPDIDDYLAVSPPPPPPLPTDAVFSTTPVVSSLPSLPLHETVTEEYHTGKKEEEDKVHCTKRKHITTPIPSGHPNGTELSVEALARRSEQEKPHRSGSFDATSSFSSSMVSSACSSLSSFPFLPGLEHFYDPNRMLRLEPVKRGILSPRRSGKDEGSVEQEAPRVSEDIRTPSLLVTSPPVLEDVAAYGYSSQGSMETPAHLFSTAPTTIHHTTGTRSPSSSLSSLLPRYHYPNYRLGPYGVFAAMTKEVHDALKDVREEITDEVLPFRADTEEQEIPERWDAGIEMFNGDWKAYRLAPVVQSQGDTPS